MTEQRKQLLQIKLQKSRFRMAMRDGDLAEPLWNMTYVATREVRRISTNGEYIFFDPTWLNKLSDFALDFALGHQLMHIQLGHINRSMLFQGDRYHLACDIIANANLVPYGLVADSIPGIGKVFTETFFPKMDGATLSAEEAFDMVPFDPATLKKGKRDRYMIDDESWWGKPYDSGNSGIIVLCPADLDPEDLSSNPEYGQLIRIKRKEFRMQKRKPMEDEDDDEVDNGQAQEMNNECPNWDKASLNSIQSLRQIKEQSMQQNESVHSGIRYWHPLRNSKLSWREILHHFLQDTLQDYSFTPPDKRYLDSTFFLPDFNDYHEETLDVLFYVDTSGSVDDHMLSLVATEICSAIEQFHGKLDGSLAFFDTIVYPGISFHTVEDICTSIPDGGGGTDFRCVFHHVVKRNIQKPISSIVIFTDGEGAYPDEWKLSIPVLWILNNKNATPPFGTVVRM